jgi:hypothetical protein
MIPTCLSFDEARRLSDQLAARNSGTSTRRHRASWRVACLLDLDLGRMSYYTATGAEATARAPGKKVEPPVWMISPGRGFYAQAAIVEANDPWADSVVARSMRGPAVPRPTRQGSFISLPQHLPA